MSLFATPAAKPRRRHRRKHAGMARRGTPEVERQRIDKEIASTWRECFLDGSGQAAWEHASFLDACLRYRRAFVGVPND